MFALHNNIKQKNRQKNSFITVISIIILSVIILFTSCSTKNTENDEPEGLYDYYVQENLLNHVFGRYMNTFYYSFALVEPIEVSRPVPDNANYIVIKAKVIEDYYNIAKKDSFLLIPVIIGFENGKMLDSDDISFLMKLDRFIVHARTTTHSSAFINVMSSPFDSQEEGYENCSWVSIEQGKFLPITDNRLNLELLNTIADKYNFKSPCKSIIDFDSFFCDGMSIEQVGESIRQLELKQEIRFANSGHYCSTAKKKFEQIALPENNGGVLIELFDVDPYFYDVSFKVTNNTEKSLQSLGYYTYIENENSDDFSTKKGVMETVVVHPGESYIFTLQHELFYDASSPVNISFILHFSNQSYDAGKYLISDFVTTPRD